MPTDAVWIMITIPSREYQEKLEIDSFNERNASNYWEDVLDDCLTELGVEDAGWVKTKNGNFYQIYFPCDLYDNDNTLYFLQSHGIGTKSLTSLGYIPFNLFYNEEQKDDEVIDDGYYEMSSEARTRDNDGQKSKHSPRNIQTFKDATKAFLRSVTSRMTVAQVVEGIRASSEVTFDFCLYVIFGGWVAFMGLLDSSSVIVAASMTIEPIMSTVMAITFGIVINDWKLFWTGVKGMLVAFALSLIWGFLAGMVIFIWGYQWEPPNGIFPTSEMISRGTIRSLWDGALVCLPAGGAVAVTLLNNNQLALVGVAIASTFMPPMICCGLLFSLSCHLHIRGLGEELELHNYTDPNTGNMTFEWLKPSWVPHDGYESIWFHDLRLECAMLALFNFIYFWINVFSMLLMCYIVLKVKEVTPLGKIDKKTKRFFQTDIKEMRDANKRKLTEQRDSNLAQDILQEWADLTGLDQDEFLSSKPEARLTQLQTLYDLAQDIEEDETYQNATRNAIGYNERSSLTSRLTQSSIFHDARRMSRAMAFSGFSGNHLTMSGTSRSRKNSRRSIFNRNGINDLPPLPAFGPKSERSRKMSRVSFQAPISGLRVETLGDTKNRRSLQLLRKTLNESERSPFSVWPANLHGHRKSLNLDGVRRRTIQPLTTLEGKPNNPNSPTIIFTTKL